MSIYQVGQMKRARSTKAEVEKRRNALFDVVKAMRPMKVQHVFYQATKATDSRAKNFGDIGVELDAIRPDTLRDLVEATIHRHLPPEQFDVLKAAEASERQLLEGLVGMIGGQLS